MFNKVVLTVNGLEYELYVKSNKRLLDIIREDIGLMGTKCSCQEGECGACTVIMDGEAINSCMVLAAEVNGKHITTIEGLANGSEMHPLQKAFIKVSASQCGFCTPGMIMSAKALLDKNPNPTEEEIKHEMAGNLCRCTGYSSILSAIKLVVEGGGLDE